MFLGHGSDCGELPNAVTANRWRRGPSCRATIRRTGRFDAGGL